MFCIVINLRHRGVHLCYYFLDFGKRLALARARRLPANSCRCLKGSGRFYQLSCVPLLSFVPLLSRSNWLSLLEIGPYPVTCFCDCWGADCR
jgi:hypothetical protein